jgi:transposase
VGRVGFALAPLVERLKHLLRQQNMLHADETPVAQLDPGQGKTKRAYLWAYRSVDSPHSNAPRIVVFDYQSGRAGKHAANFLQDWKGELMVDDYAGYKALFTSGITELGCWAHVRRKFFDIQAASPHPRASQALAQIGALYDIERQAQDQNMGANQRAQLRREQAQPKLAQLLDWLSQTLQSSAPNSAIARATSYTLKRWPALTRYADNGERPIDNNPVENAIRPIAIGRKNWLFAGSEMAGQRAANIQSLLYTAKLNGLDPAAWLKNILDQLPTCLNSNIDALLPLRSSSPFAS